ncbi:hypothetical protein HanIR_Chr05g0241161 [Helianthus annuus]|nr:hypothetical protein HanIR_Chr05g0241161 [Helianthus annuus]
MTQQTLYTRYLVFVPTLISIRIMLMLIHILLIRFTLLLVHILLTRFFFFVYAHTFMIHTFVPIRERNPRDSLAWVPHIRKHGFAYILHSCTYTF